VSQTLNGRLNDHSWYRRALDADSRFVLSPWQCDVNDPPHGQSGGARQEEQQEQQQEEQEQEPMEQELMEQEPMEQEQQQEMQEREQETEQEQEQMYHDDIWSLMKDLERWRLSLLGVGLISTRASCQILNSSLCVPGPKAAFLASPASFVQLSFASLQQLCLQPPTSQDEPGLASASLDESLHDLQQKFLLAVAAMDHVEVFELLDRDGWGRPEEPVMLLPLCGAGHVLAAAFETQ
jgi:hypothetical protein